MQPLKKKQKHNPTTNRPVVLGRLYLDEVEEWTTEDVAVILLRICSLKVVNVLKQENKLFNGEAFLYIAQQHGKKIAEETDQHMEEIYKWIKTKISPKLFTLYSPEETMKVLVTTKSLLDSGGGGLNREHYVKYFFPKLDGRYLGSISKSLRLNGKETTLRLLQDEFKQENNDELTKIITWVEQNNYMENQYFPTITQLLNQMKKLNETPLPYRFVKFDMIYVERKQALESYFNYLDTLHVRSSDPKETGSTVMFIGASPGVGKSRFAYELHKFIETRYSKEIQNLKMINLVTWFSNGGNFTGCELDGDKPIDLMRSIVARIIYSYIVHVNRHSWLIDIPINESVSTNLNLISSIFTTLGYVYRREDNDNWLVDVFKWIEGNEKEEGKKLWIHFTLDEYNQIIRSLPAQTCYEKESIFDECINLLSDVPFFMDCYFSNLLSGTHIQSCKNLKSAAFGGKVFLRRIELKNFDEEEQNQIYCNQKFPNSVTLKSLFHSFGGHARLIGQFNDNVGLPSDQILSTISKVIISQDRGSIMIGLEENISVLESIISLCITRFPINIDTTLDSFNSNSSLRILQRSMILFFTQTSKVEPTVIVSIPLVVLFLLVSHIRLTNKQHFLTTFPTEFKEWLDYGIINSHFLNIRMKCFKLLHDKGIIPYYIGINYLLD